MGGQTFLGKFERDFFYGGTNDQIHTTWGMGGGGGEGRGGGVHK